MIKDDVDGDKYGSDDDERFYEETVYNEYYYINQENERIRQANLELEFENSEDSHDWVIDDNEPIEPLSFNISEMPGGNISN